MSARHLVHTVALLVTGLAAATDGQPAGAQPTPQSSFFVTSTGNGAGGGNYGGLDGADQRCQSLAETAGIGTGRSWRAYLSTAPIAGFGGELVHARDRIGPGPWFNVAGDQVAADLASLHADGIAAALMLDELGNPVPSNEHDVLTGSMADGTAFPAFPANPDAPTPTCLNWTSNDSQAYTWVGHADWFAGQSWNSQHESTCDELGLASTLGSGRLYCFALAAAPVFADGFESGDTAAWSATVRP